ncbi:MFS transporter [Desulfothermobacter acidiphilus]|uniref:MFS transporter n=1 Tax=Desulfothermobacter acidiphilus TaxID=1938353 RepID=UPI003F8C206D
MVLGNSLLIPILPSLKRNLGMTNFQTGLVLSLFSLAAGFAIPGAGFLADRAGRRRVLLPSLVLFTLGGLGAGVSALASSVHLLLLSRTLQGLGAAGTAPVAMAIIGDAFQGRDRVQAMGLFEAFNGLGKIISPILGAALGLLGFFYPFFLFPALTLPLLFLLWRLIPETRGQKNLIPSVAYQDKLQRLSQHQGLVLIGAFLSGFTTLFVLFGLLFFLSEHLEVVWGIKGISKGLWLALPTACACTSAVITSRFVRPQSPQLRYLALGGTAVSGQAIMGLASVSQLLPQLAVAAAIGVSAGVTLTSLNTLVTSSTGPATRGLVTSLYGGVRFFGAASGPALFSLLNPRLAFVLSGLLAGFTFALLLLGHLQQRKHP